jgi:hypothetical protein
MAAKDRTTLKSDLSVDYVRSVLSYNPDTGEFRWKLREGLRGSWNKKFYGKVAGSLNSGGYWQIAINNRHYYGHRLAWVVFYGEWPSKGIDHIDGNTANNRISNLRLATYSENGRNRLAPSNNSSGYKGVYWSRRRERWESRISISEKQIHLGYFHDIEDAKRSRQIAEKRYFGEFRRKG